MFEFEVDGVYVNHDVDARPAYDPRGSQRLKPESHSFRLTRRRSRMSDMSLGAPAGGLGARMVAGGGVTPTGEPVEQKS